MSEDYDYNNSYDDMIDEGDEMIIDDVEGYEEMGLDQYKEGEEIKETRDGVIGAEGRCHMLMHHLVL